MEGEDAKVTFTDDLGNTISGTISADGQTIIFGKNSNPVFSSWSLGQRSVTTTPATTAAAATAPPTTTAAPPVATTTQAVVAGDALIAGDPHIKVQVKGQEPICFDVLFDDNDAILLLEDLNTNLRITGQMHAESSRNRLAAVGVELEKGTQIEIHGEYILINGASVSYAEDRNLKFSDGTINIVLRDEIFF